jgi:hypothetical protein
MELNIKYDCAAIDRKKVAETLQHVGRA